MLDVKFLEEALPNIDNWSYGQLKDIKLLSREEVEEILRYWNGYRYRGNVEYIVNCDDVFRLCITALYYMNPPQLILPDNLDDSLEIRHPSNTDNRCAECEYDTVYDVECYDCVKGIRDGFKKA